MFYTLKWLTLASYVLPRLLAHKLIDTKIHLNHYFINKNKLYNKIMPYSLNKNSQIKLIIYCLDIFHC